MRVSPPGPQHDGFIYIVTSSMERFVLVLHTRIRLQIFYFSCFILDTLPHLFTYVDECRTRSQNICILRLEAFQLPYYDLERNIELNEDSSPGKCFLLPVCRLEYLIPS